ncbi:MAG TPA: hypothetical protein VFH38_00590 [Jatrophihabitans sp.]|nr:hypothetical protein [Jatrophihabitans sp.]
MTGRTPAHTSTTARRGRHRLRAATAAATGALAALALAAAAPGAQARPAAGATGGSLVYVKNGAIHLAHADGTHDRVVKKGSWYFVSMDNHGVIAAMAADGRSAPDGSTGYSVYRMSKTGKILGRTPTPVDYSSFGCPTYPSEHVSLSPDGTTLAYDYSDCNGEHVVWAPASGKLRLHAYGDYFAPQWRSAKQLVISHFGTTLTANQATVGLWTTSGRPKGWTAGLADSWATSYHAAATRDGTKIALIEDDAANYFDAVPRHVRLVFGTAAGPGRPVKTRCAISLPPNLYAASNWRGTTPAVLSFRPDGNLLAWDAGNGIWTARTRSLAACTKTSLHAQLWIRGGGYPYFSPAG